jgi:hypothetical protein
MPPPQGDAAPARRRRPAVGGLPQFPKRSHAMERSLLAAAAEDAAGGAAMILMLLYLALIVLMLASMWVIYAKAGKPGWAAIIPIYNIIVLLEIVGRPIWWILLWLVPCVNVVVAIVVVIDLAKSFGKDVAFAIGLLLLGIVFYPILAFGSARYIGPAAGRM